MTLGVDRVTFKVIGSFHKRSKPPELSIAGTNSKPENFNNYFFFFAFSILLNLTSDKKIKDDLWDAM